jgi:hypothetical protein
MLASAQKQCYGAIVKRFQNDKWYNLIIRL